MSPGAARLFFAVGLAFLVGNASGAWVTRAVYGSHEEEIDPAPVRQRICAPCPDCPVCPAPPPCGALSEIPTSSTTPRAVFVPDEDPDRDRKPGLPASAIDLATRKVREEVAPCIASSTDLRGSVLLALTVTATGGQGFISDVAVVERSGDAVSSEALEDCLLEGARRARFDWTRGDGESHARLPIALRRR